jgi:hypothetical protein
MATGSAMGLQKGVDNDAAEKQKATGWPWLS